MVLSKDRDRRAFLRAGVATVASAALVRGPARAAQYEFKCAWTLPVDHPAVVRGKQMWAAVERESGGRLRVESFPNSILGGDTALISQLRLGALQFFIGLGNLPTVIPVIDVTILGFAFKDVDEAERAADGPLGDYIRREFPPKGMYAFPKMWGSGMRQITTSTRPIRVPDDLHDLKIRVVESKINVDFFKTLGASPVPMSASELYTAMQTKVVDGEDLPLATIAAGRFYEVQKYLSLTSHNWSGLMFLANAEMWAHLPPDLQEIVTRNQAKFAFMQRRDMKILNASVADKLARFGLLINKVDPETFRTRLRPYYATWSSAFGPTVWGLMQNSLSRKID